jgi:D-3-phosphoglycerate dehydrogenase
MKASGIDLTYDDKLNADSLEKAMGEIKPEVLIVRSTKVTAAMIDANPNLALIIRAGAGFDTIDFKHCSTKGIFVANCPGKNATAVAELALGLVLSIDRRIAEGVQWMKEGKWKKGVFAKCLGLKGRTLGIIGFGNIGKLVGARAKAFEMNVAFHDDWSHEVAGYTKCATLDDLLKISDIVSIHMPSLPTTIGMINSKFLGKMKSNSVLINTSRGDLANEDDLLVCLNTNNNFWYGTDVYKGEPSGKEADFDHKIAKHPQVYGTHHQGASTKQAEAEIGEEAVRIVKKFNATGTVDDGNCVNKARPEKTHNSVSIKYANKPNVLGHVFTVLGGANWEVHEFSNVVLQGRDACMVTVAFVGDASKEAEVVEALKKNEHVVGIKVSKA